MAFLDFLNSGIGGMQQAQGPNLPAQGPNPTGEAGVFSGAGVGAPQPIGPTYGDIARAALQYGSKPGSSGPMLAGIVPQSKVPYGQQALQPLDPNAPAQSKGMAGQAGSGDDTLGMILKWFTSLMGAGV
jgi:hypothetical protein